MKRRVFYSFHYIPDSWRAAKVRNIGVIEGNAPASGNDWETIKKGGDAAIQRWIDNQLYGKSCTIVLIGAKTAGRKWINYEIQKSWNNKKGLLGIYIHKLTNSTGEQSMKGANPFEMFTVDNAKLSSIVHAYDPLGYDSPSVYTYIKDNLSDWVEEAISIRNTF